MIANANDGRAPVETLEKPPGSPAMQASVADELEAIFAGSPAGGSPSRVRGSPVRSLERPAPREANRGTMWGGAVACLLLGAVAVASVATQQRSPSAPPPPPSTPALADLVVEPMPAPLLTPKPSSRPATPAVRAPHAQPAPHARFVAVRRSAPAPRAATAGRAEARAEATGCARLGGDAMARCLWPAVMQADHDLRKSYNRAIDAGVRRSVLVSYLNRWSSLRHEARRDPQRVIAAYRSMAADLDDARSREAGG